MINKIAFQAIFLKRRRKKMFLHLGSELSVLKKNIIGIFDYDIVKKSKDTKEFLEIATNEGTINKIKDSTKNKSFVVTDEHVYLSPISSLTLEKRIVNFEYMITQEDEEN